MGVLSGLEPKAVFQYFEELSVIPRQTYNIGAASDFCVAFAKEHGLSYIQDEAKNVIIFKPGTEGYENSDPVVLQGHMDMVAVKTDDSDHDFNKDPLDLFVDGNLIGAKNTSLGGDDGIAIAYAMAVLASDDIPHPPIEAVFTVDEEQGMGGALALDPTVLKGRVFLNLDSEEEGVMTVGCAGGYIWDTMIPVERSGEEGTEVTLLINGFLGGHSGMEINKQRGNAHKTIGRILYALSKEFDFNMISTDGGQAANAIAQKNVTKLVVESEQAEALAAKAAKLWEEIIAEYMGSEPDATMEVTVGAAGTFSAMDAASTDNVIRYLYGAPDEVQTYDRAFPGEPETSLNTGVVTTTEDEVTIRFQVRSSVASKLEMMKDKLAMWTEMVGGSYEVSGAYPAWKYDPDSKARPMAIEIFKEMFGYEPKVENTHGGLECGILYDRNPNFDIISFGPNLHDVHSVNERVDIASTARMWEFLKAILKACK